MKDKVKYVHIYQHGQIVKMPYWDFIMQRSKEDRIRNISRGDDLHPSLSEVKVCEKEKEVVV